MDSISERLTKFSLFIESLSFRVACLLAFLSNHMRNSGFDLPFVVAVSIIL